MRSRTRTSLAAGFVLAGLAFAPITNAQLFEGERSHGDSKDTMIASELIAAGLSERVGAQECTDTNDDGVEDSLTVNGVRFECTNVDMLSFVPNAEIMSGLPDGVSDIWGWESPAGEEYVIAGATTGAAVLRVTDPEDPEYLGHVVNNGAALVWFDIKVNNDHAYIVSESPAMGMKILDLTLLDALPEVAVPGTTVPLPVTTYPIDLVAHNVVIDEAADMLYLVGSGQALGNGGVCTTSGRALDNAGLHAVDISNPVVPVYVGCHAAEGYVHDAHCATYTGPDTEHADTSICVTAHEDGVAWVDMTDPAAPVTLFDTATAENADELYPDVAYSHQGWMSEDQTLYYHGDEGDEPGQPMRTFVYDMTDLDGVKLSFINRTGGRNIDHNMYTHRGLLFQSNYTAGLQVFDQVPVEDEVTGEQSLELVAEFDVFPDDRGLDLGKFAGTWSNYPYFDSGTLAVTATEDGLFFLRLSPEVEAAYPVAE